MSIDVKLSNRGERAIVTRMRLVDERGAATMAEAIAHAEKYGIFDLSDEDFHEFRNETVRLHMTRLKGPTP